MTTGCRKSGELEILKLCAKNSIYSDIKERKTLKKWSSGARRNLFDSLRHSSAQTVQTYSFEIS